MLHVFAKSSQGYSHKKINKVCQDFSCQYADKERVIVTVADGHGGDVYIRSDKGSSFASKSLLNVFTNLTYKDVLALEDENFKNKVKLEILCEWNRLIEDELSNKPIRRKETSNLTEEQQESLSLYPVRAFGTTLCGAMLLKGKLVVVSIGDSESFIIRKGEICRVFDDENEPVANITYSMCQEDAFNYLNIKVIDFKGIDGVILCTDGLTSPYQSYDNFNQSFAKPLIKKVAIEHDIKYVDLFIDAIASKLGTGDDVSLSYIINGSAFKKYYR